MAGRCPRVGAVAERNADMTLSLILALADFVLVADEPDRTRHRSRVPASSFRGNTLRNGEHNGEVERFRFPAVLAQASQRPISLVRRTYLLSRCREVEPYDDAEAVTLWRYRTGSPSRCWSRDADVAEIARFILGDVEIRAACRRRHGAAPRLESVIQAETGGRR